MSIETKKIQQLRKKEAELQAPVTIKSINDYISLMQRYRDYLDLLNDHGAAVAKKLYPNHYKSLKLDELLFTLYLDAEKKQIVFENECFLALYVEADNSFPLSSLTNLFNNREFCDLQSCFSTPVVISDDVIDRLPKYVLNSDENCVIDDTIKDLMTNRVGKIERLMHEY